MFDKFGNKNPEYTTEISPESIWQENERHFCMIGKNDTSFPLIPLDISRIASLTVRIHRQSTATDIASELLADLPISIDGANQWFAKGSSEKGEVELLFKPEWGENNTRLVYRKSSKQRISPKEIHSAVVAMSGFKNDIMQRLAV